MTLTSVSTLERVCPVGFTALSRKKPASERERYIQIIARRLQFSRSICYPAFNDARKMRKEDLEKVLVQGTSFDPIERIFELLTKPAIRTDGTIGGIMSSPLQLSVGQARKLLCSEGETITGNALAIRLLLMVNPLKDDD